MNDEKQTPKPLDLNTETETQTNPLEATDQQLGRMGIRSTEGKFDPYSPEGPLAGTTPPSELTPPVIGKQEQIPDSYTPGLEKPVSQTDQTEGEGPAQSLGVEPVEKRPEQQ